MRNSTLVEIIYSVSISFGRTILEWRNRICNRGIQWRKHQSMEFIFMVNDNNSWQGIVIQMILLNCIVITFAWYYILQHENVYFCCLYKYMKTSDLNLDENKPTLFLLYLFGSSKKQGFIKNRARGLNYSSKKYLNNTFLITTTPFPITANH